MTSNTLNTTHSNAADYAVEVAKGPKRQWRDAFRAVGNLLRDKEDTTQVFAIMSALRGNAIEKGAARFASLPEGRAILDREEELLDILADRKWLASLPEGSLGRVYLDFMIRENITAEGLVEASEDTGYMVDNPVVARYGRRVRDQHDLWHVISGYGRDGVGEACVVAFSYAQTKSLGFAAIALMAGYKFSREFKGEGIMRAVWQAYRNGRRAAWLPGQDWKHLLTLPLSDVRNQLQVRQPTRYLAAEKAIAGTGMQTA